MSALSAPHKAYKKVDVETASQGQLIVLLLNGAISKAEEAKRYIESGASDITQIHKSLIRAQDIIAELRGALNMSAGEISENLDRIYEYFQHLLIQANVEKEPQHLVDCVLLMTSVRDAWQELFETLAKEEEPNIVPPQIDPHGAAVMNLEG